MELLTVGRIVNTFGTSGELKIVSFSDFSAKRYALNATMLLRNEETNEEKQVTVTGYRSHKGLDLVRFAEIDATNATKYFSWYVLAPKDAIKLPKQTYFHADLVGCSLIDETGAKLGAVTSVVDYGAHPILKAETPAGHSFQVPFVPFFIVKVDIASKTITINVVDGLI